MKFKVDHDYHIHTYLSSCSRNPEQNIDFILGYAKQNGLRSLCITDHFWDDAVEGSSKWYAPQNLEHIREILPFPDDAEVNILFGCEGELRRDLTLGISREKFDCFDMIVIPTTHMHMSGFTVSEDGSETVEERAALWVERLDALLSMDLPFRKVGIAHLACFLINRKSEEDYLATVKAIPDGEMTRLFTKAAGLGVGIELNDGVLLQGEDPFLYANALQQNEPIVLEAEVLLTGGRYLEVLKDAVIGENAGYSQLRADIELQTAHNAALRSEMEVLQRDLEAYIILANNKDKWALELQQELEKYRRFPLVRLGAYAVRVTKKICRTAKRILKRCFRA